MAKKQPKRWVYSPPKPPKPAVPKAVKAEVEQKVREFIEAELKPEHVKPPRDARFNYLADITCKWHGPYFYVVGIFACPGPNALSPTFESKLARLLYAGPGRFTLSFQRHTGQWIDLYTGLSLKECLEAVRDDPWFMPA